MAWRRLQLRSETFAHEAVARFVASGVLDRHSGAEAILDLNRRPGATRARRVLLDLSEARSELAISSTFDLVALLVQSLLGSRVALLPATACRSDVLEFAEVCAHNRGLRLKALSSESHALQWLTEGERRSEP